MKVENLKVFNFENAIRGMRNPLESYVKSDSKFGIAPGTLMEHAIIGPNDMKLAKNLISSGNEHRKFLRHILVSMDITAPEYWWKEMATYTVGVQSPNSTSTMHRIASQPLTLDLFETDDLDSEVEIENFKKVLDICEDYRLKFKETGDKRYWKALVRLLPFGWLYKKTWTANYEVLRNIYHQRKGHKLTEWHTFLKYLETLPYAQDFIII